MTVLRAIAIAALLLAPALAQAQSDEDPFGDDTSYHPRHHRRHHSDDEDDQIQLDDETTDPSARNMARIDDPRLGLGAELSLSYAMLGFTNHQPKETGPAFGLRIDWAPGFLVTAPEYEVLRQVFVLELTYDAMWAGGGPSRGTAAVNTSASRLQNLDLRVTAGYPAGRALYLYGALGGGFSYQTVRFNIQDSSTAVTGWKPNLAYGLGVRFTIPASDQVGVTLRLESIFFRRGNFNDVFLTAGGGVSF